MGFRGRLGYAGYIITDNFLHQDKEYENTKNDYLYSEERLISEKVLNVLTNIQHFMYTVMAIYKSSMQVPAYENRR